MEIFLEPIKKLRGLLEGILILLIVKGVLEAGASQWNMWAQWLQKIGMSRAIGQLFVGNFVQSIVVIALVWWMGCGVHRKNRQFFGLRRWQGQWIAKAVLNGVLLCLAMLLISGILCRIIPQMPNQPIVDVTMQVDTLLDRWAIYFLSGILAPISEELLFRGYIYGFLAEHMRSWQAGMIAAAFFAAMHFDVYRFPLLFLSGYWLNAIYVRAQSIYASMLAHACWNIIMIALILK